MHHLAADLRFRAESFGFGFPTVTDVSRPVASAATPSHRACGSASWTNCLTAFNGNRERHGLADNDPGLADLLIAGVDEASVTIYSLPERDP